MATTHGLPYPTTADAPNGPTQIQALAEAVDTKLLTGGKSIIATSETRTNTAYGLLTTPDRVQNVVLPTDGLITIWYQASWQESVQGAARAGLFLGSNQVVTGYPGNASPLTREAYINVAAAVGHDVMLGSYPLGLASNEDTAFGGGYTAAYAGDATTGQVVGGGFVRTEGLTDAVQQGGPCYVFAAAGTYDVSVRFLASSGSVTVKNRKLWVRAIAF